MASDLTPTRLGDCADILTGFPFKSAEYAAEGRRLLRGDNIVQGRLRWDGVKFWSSDNSAPEQYVLSIGDIVLAMDRPWIEAGLKCARIGKHDAGALLVQRVARLRAKAHIDPGYLYCVIRSAAFTEYILGVQTGTAVPHISKEQINSFPVLLPDFSQQCTIGGLATSLDDRIEVMRTSNQVLESLARAIFRSWFVNFDPVRAKAEGREPVGMDEATAALFPGELVNSGIGEIPAGWERKTAGDLVEVEKGLSYKGAFLTDAGLPMINLGCFSAEGRFDSHKLKRYSGDYKRRHTVVAGDLLMANTDITQKRLVLGSPIIVPDLDSREFIFTHHTFAIRPKLNIEGLKEYLYFTLLQPSFRERAMGFAMGTTVLALPKDAILKLEMVMPPKQLLQKFFGWTGTFNDKINCNRKVSETLTELRDTLLPRLVSGKLRVPEAEKLLEAVL